MSATTGRRFLGRIEWVFAAMLVVAAAGVWIYQSLVIGPEQRCGSSGNWWDGHTRTCGHVVYLPDITHRPIGSRRGGGGGATYPNLPSSVGQGAAGTSQAR